MKCKNKNKQSFRLRKSGYSFKIVAILAILLSSQMRALWKCTIFGHIDISLPLIAAGLIIVLGLVRATRISLKFSTSFTSVLVLSSIFTIWVGFQALRSPQPTRGLTMFLIMLTDLAVFLAIGTARTQKEISYLNRTVFYLGATTAAISLIFYAKAFLNYQYIQSNTQLWRPPLIYEFTFRRILQLEGFTGDPNTFGIFYVIPLFCGIAMKRTKRKFLKWISILLLATALFLTYSRGLLLSLVLSTACMLIIAVFFHRRVWQGYAIKIIVFLSLVIVSLSFIPQFRSSTPMEIFTSRFQKMPSKRLSHWHNAVQLASSNYIIGHGLRAGEELIGGRYLENSYLDLLVETGIIGFGIYLVIIMSTLKRSIEISKRSSGMIPWFHGLLVMIFQFFYISMLYNLLLWTTLGIILSSRLDLQTKKTEI